jgi:hypothetical protein
VLFDELRIEFVEAFFAANQCQISICKSEDCAHSRIVDIFPLLGISYVGFVSDNQYEFKGKSSRIEISGLQQDALLGLNEFSSEGSLSKNVSFLEFSNQFRPAAEWLNNFGWRDRLSGPLSSAPWAHEATKKDFLLELVSAAFPDKYLLELRELEEDSQLSHNDAAIRDLRRTFSSLHLVSPYIPGALAKSLEIAGPYWDWNSKSPWRIDACSLLEAGVVEDLNDVGNYTRKSIARVPFDYLKLERDDYWMCALRSMAPKISGMGIVAQFGGIFISQQSAYLDVYRAQHGLNVNTHMNAYNEFLAPLEEFNSSLQVGVLFSDYQRYAAIFSRESRAWVRAQDFETSQRWEIPNGWGLVVDLNSQNVVTFRSRLNEIVGMNYSPQLTASANYLLRAVRSIES